MKVKLGNSYGQSMKTVTERNGDQETEDDIYKTKGQKFLKRYLPESGLF
jgi:hypothetical protein